MEAFQKTLHRQPLGRSPAGMRAQRTSPAVKYMRRGHVPFVSAFQEPEPGLFERFHIRADDDHASLLDFSSSTNSAWDFRMVPAHLGQPWPRNRLPPTGAHSQPHTSHLTATRERQFSYVPTTVILRFRAFRARTNSKWLFFFIMRSGYAVKRKSRLMPAPVSVRWIGDVSGAPRPNARRRRQDPRRRPAGVSSGSPTSGGS